MRFLLLLSFSLALSAVAAISPTIGTTDGAPPPQQWQNDAVDLLLERLAARLESLHAFKRHLPDLPGLTALVSPIHQYGMPGQVSEAVCRDNLLKEQNQLSDYIKLMTPHNARQTQMWDRLGGRKELPATPEAAAAAGWAGNEQSCRVYGKSADQRWGLKFECRLCQVVPAGRPMLQRSFRRVRMTRLVHHPVIVSGTNAVVMPRTTAQRRKPGTLAKHHVYALPAANQMCTLPVVHHFLRTQVTDTVVQRHVPMVIYNCYTQFVSRRTLPRLAVQPPAPSV